MSFYVKAYTEAIMYSYHDIKQRGGSNVQSNFILLTSIETENAKLLIQYSKLMFGFCILQYTLLNYP